MKKIMLVLLAAFMLAGCSIGKNKHSSLFVENNGKMALISPTGDLKTEFEYTNYTHVGKVGYIVEKGDQQSVITHNGDELLPYMQGVSYSAIGEVIVAQSENSTILYDHRGEELYRSGAATTIDIYGLPVVCQNNQYYVLDLEGEVLHESQDRIIYASQYNEELFSISYGNATLIIDTTLENSEPLKASIAGNYDLIGHEYGLGYAFYDDETNMFIYVDAQGNTVVSKKYEVDSVAITKDSIILRNSKETRVISIDGQSEYSANSYYRSAKNYLMKNDQNIYGPHKFIGNGQVTEVEHIQLSPDVRYVLGNIFPVYVQAKGFEYYNFKGTQAFDGAFAVAGDFDSNKRAIVSEEGNKFYMIDNKGTQLSEEYVKIEPIAKGYYAAYESMSKFKVMNADGQIVIDDYFIGDGDVYHYNGTDYLLLHKSGSTYVYEAKEYELVFSLDGECEIYDEIYLKEKNSKAYYTMDGDVIYER